MKKVIFLSLLLGLVSIFNVSAQQRQKIGDGVYITTYGNVTVIENDNIGMTTQLSVEKAGTNNYGETIYNVLCENKVVKGVAKAGLTAALKTALTGAGIPIPSWAIGPIVSAAYDAVCDYFDE